ncbi:phosphatidylglycerophosphatase A [Halioglobus japonicus]|uniref:Phosphatidylglycerophosphatase A n=2 Tax=Halioglobus japonicus TaxID=930805 RepID=A0AAP8MBS1_9GAMM|nr:phosphatidylglycerophosphatase A [Halioglobus japonicus]PLW84883.1 phosphatidylglycerophosphatase A [Halioglobus japonicus]
MPDSISPNPLKSPIQFLAFGLGSGLAPKAPGTFGTIAAVPLFWLLSHLSLEMYTVALVVAFVAGIWICDKASKELGVHDHPGIVWDEFVGYWLTMWALPADWVWMLAGFVAFRIFDIAKPWPIGWLDKRVDGGLGIMIDDIVAGLMACGVLHIAHTVIPAQAGIQ